MNINSIPLSLDSQTNCHICGDKFNELDIIVRDHDHRTSLYRGRAHHSCNLQYRYKLLIPIIIHNLAGYDSHLIFKKKLSSKFINSTKIIPINSEKFTLLTVFNSYTHLLSNLTNILKNSNYNFPIFNTLKKKKINKHRFLLLRKGVFSPYSYFDNEKILYENCLPDKKILFLMKFKIRILVKRIMIMLN